MHYYQFNIGDYHSHTSHLDPLEDIAYRRMLDYCYLNEIPLPLEVDEIARLIRMRSHTDCIEIVLRDFFQKTKDGYIQPRVNDEVAKYHDKSAKAKKSAEARWGNKNKGKADANALQTQSEGNANHKPITNNHKPSEKEPSVPECPQQDIVNLYHEKLPGLRQMRVWSGDRQKMLRARWREDAKRQTLDYWEKLFDYIKQSEFLMGDENNFMDLEWIVRPTNFIKIIEGKYHA